jgi:hypothetical protein
LLLLVPRVRDKFNTAHSDFFLCAQLLLFSGVRRRSGRRTTGTNDGAAVLKEKQKSERERE